MAETPVRHLVIPFPLTNPQTDLVRAAAPEFTVTVLPRSGEHDALLRQAEICFGSGTGFRLQSAVESPQLRWVQLLSAGADALVDSPLWRRRDVTLTTANGIHATPMAEWVLGAMIMHVRRWPSMVLDQQHHEYRAAWRNNEPGGGELRDATLGIVGLGHIGQEIARLGHAFGMRVLAMRRHGAEPEPNVDEMFPHERLHDLLADSDFVVLVVPSTPETLGLIGPAELAAMKPGSVLINIARGGIVDEPALIQALESGHLGGALLDVFAEEPLPKDNPLWDLPNVILTPHISGWTTRYYDRATGLFVENLRRYRAGESLINVVDRERGY